MSQTYRDASGRFISSEEYHRREAREVARRLREANRRREDEKAFYATLQRRHHVRVIKTILFGILAFLIGLLIVR